MYIISINRYKSSYLLNINLHRHRRAIKTRFSSLGSTLCRTVASDIHAVCAVEERLETEEQLKMIYSHGIKDKCGRERADLRMPFVKMC